MKSLLKLGMFLAISSSILVASTCSNEKKAQMIVNGVEQSVIDEICGVEENEKVDVIDTTINNYQTEKQKSYDNYQKQESYSNSTFIEKDRLYVGLSYSSLSGTQTIEYEYYDYPDTDIEVSGPSFSVGYVASNNNRMELVSSNFTYAHENGNENDISSLDFNIILMMGKANVKSGNFKPYFLLGVGQSTDEADLTGININLGLGANYSIGQSVGLDLGYHYKYIAWEEMEDFGITVTSAVTGIVASARFKF